MKHRRSDIREIRDYLINKHGGACQSCGIANVPLEIAFLYPAATNPSEDPRDYALLCANCLRSLDSFAPNEIEFTYFLCQLLTAHPDFSGVEIDRPLGDARGTRADLTAFRSEDDRRQKLLIESKSRSFFRHSQIEKAIAQIEYYKGLEKFDAAALAFPGKLSSEDKAKLEKASIEIWDLDYVAKKFSSEIKTSGQPGFAHLYSFSLAKGPKALQSKEEILLNRLKKCGGGRRGWVEYQRIIENVFELLFTPPLGKPIWELSDYTGTNRRDIIIPNYSDEGFWKFLRESYSADFIVVDPKNYKSKIKKAQILQIANYLKPHGTGMFAIITSRSGADAGSITTMRELWAAYRKLIIVLDDDDIEAMLLASISGGKPTDVIGQVIQEFRLSM